MQDKIAALICQLAEQGKDISVGLVRSKLTERAPLPFITRTINQYKANPQQFLESHAHLKNKPAETNTPTNTDNATNHVEQLQKRVDILEQEVAELTSRLASLERN
ncbi:hypothetical protein HR060_13510 [Catenovulum sp. SM1970]|uniref:hypothetical protein n=1 Tax=Marinifaba aquimaris TaxID=2741323 RepID=UPI0015724AB7|nr:hypothetical protein [Marinifaba aquimaris]NTS77872.1 hypothetical protein [Marinifaba aquimaris]